MFGIGFGEITLLTIIALILLGPKECAKYYRKIKSILSLINDSKIKIKKLIDDQLSDRKDS